MAFVSVLILAIFSGLVVSQTEYSVKYEKIDLDEILNNERLLENYVNCLLDKGKCTPDGEELKHDIPDALENECGKCSDEDKKEIKKVLNFLTNNKKEMWNELEAKYDPEGKYKEKYFDLIKN